MKTLLAVSLATIYGLTLRISFGLLNAFMGIMSLSFLVLVPALIGFLTVALQPKRKVRTVSGAFFLPWLTSLVILILTIAVEIEGTICWIMMYPFFAVLAGIGGVMAYFSQKRNQNHPEEEEWRKPDTLSTTFALALPLLVGFVEGDKTLNTKHYLISRSVAIEAPAAIAWHSLTHINKIEAGESHSLFSKLIGFPKHVQTILDTPAAGGKRVALYENGLYFNETIVAYEKEKRMVLDIHTDPTHIPPKVMDEHIVIGGRHVDILEDVYTLEKVSQTRCRLTLSSRFYINTPFNWYAGIWARYLMQDLLESEIRLVKERAENRS